MEDIANTIAIYFSGENKDKKILKEAKEYVKNFSNAEGRAKKYLDIMTGALNK